MIAKRAIKSIFSDTFITGKFLPSRCEGFVVRYGKVFTGSLIFLSNLTNRGKPSNSNYDMSIKNCQVIQKSCIDRKYTTVLSMSPPLQEIKVLLHNLNNSGEV